MALTKRDNKSGGLIFHRSIDEKKQASVYRENKLLRNQLDEMKIKMSEVDDLKRIVNDLQNQINKKRK